MLRFRCVKIFFKPKFLKATRNTLNIKLQPTIPSKNVLTFFSPDWGLLRRSR